MPALVPASAQERQQHVERQRKQTEGNLADSLQAVARLEGEVAAASHRYTYVQETRGFIADMCDMLQVRYFTALYFPLRQSANCATCLLQVRAREHAQGHKELR